MSGSRPGCFWAHPSEAQCRTGGFVLNTGRFVPLSGARVIWHGPLVEARLQPTAPDTRDVPLWGGGPSTGKETWAGCGWCGSVRFCGLCTRPHLSKKKKPPRPAFGMRWVLEAVFEVDHFLKRSKAGLCVCPAVSRGVFGHTPVKQSAEQAAFPSTRAALCRQAGRPRFGAGRFLKPGAGPPRLTPGTCRCGMAVHLRP